MIEYLCTSCSARHPVTLERFRCDCGAPLDVDFESSPLDREALGRRPATLWRYREAIPLVDRLAPSTLGEGVTPVIDDVLGSTPVHLSLEYVSPTGSYKDRGASVLVAVATAPTTGSYHQVSSRVGLGALGSDYVFSRTEIDFRHYLTVANEDVLAFEAFGAFISGDAPFHKLAELGGQNRMRGYYIGRYIDDKYTTIQAEYRIPLVWRFGGVIFAGAGDVAPTLDRFRLSDVKPSYGFGIRFAFAPEERLNLRMDWGFGNNSSGMYIGIAEAF